MRLRVCCLLVVLLLGKGSEQAGGYAGEARESSCVTERPRKSINTRTHRNERRKTANELSIVSHFRTLPVSYTPYFVSYIYEIYTSTIIWYIYIYISHNTYSVNIRIPQRCNEQHERGYIIYVISKTGLVSTKKVVGRAVLDLYKRTKAPPDIYCAVAYICLSLSASLSPWRIKYTKNHVPPLSSNNERRSHGRVGVSTRWRSDGLSWRPITHAVYISYIIHTQVYTNHEARAQRYASM